VRLRLVEHLARSRLSEHHRRRHRSRRAVDRGSSIFEALHDMPRPVDVLRTIRGMLTETGCVFVGDERTEDSFTAPASERERLYYGFSILACLPSGMVGPDPAGTGTVIRSETLRRYATEAGFARVDVLPIENDSWRFYLLTP
jgi:hypothetical protein